MLELIGFAYQSKYMNIKDLQYLNAVAETQHFGQAAKKCFVSQPTLSGQIKKLEAELGVQLFERTNKNVAITDIGKDILLYSREILELCDAVKQVAESKRDPMAGIFRLGIIPTIAPYLISLILKPLGARFPQTHLVVSEDVTENLNEQLLNHQLDAAILATGVTEPEFTYIEMYQEPFCLAHHQSDPLNNVANITDEDLEGINLLLLADGHCLTHQVLNVCGQLDHKQPIIGGDLRASSLETLLQLVAVGYGSTLVPALAVKAGWMDDMGIITRQINSDSAMRRVCLVYRRTFTRKPAINTIASIINDNLPNTVKKLQ